MPQTVEPGARLVDRYRLEDHLGDRDGASYWRALDELLGRPVGVCVLDSEAERADDILTAAQRAATATDPRFLRVLDANESDGVVYVVTEWVLARSLTAMLADGPLSATDARAMVSDVADALTTAHRQGLAHLCLQPDHLLRTDDGQLKVAGLSVDAAVRGLPTASAEDAARRDAHGCGALLYAALTARWPDSEATGLPPAPHDAAGLCHPRQVRAGVPVDLDHITVRALGKSSLGHSRTSGGPITTPEELVQSLAVAHVARSHPSADTPPGGTPVPAPTTGDGPFVPPVEEPYDPGRRRQTLLTRGAWALTVLVLVVGLGLAAWQLLLVAFDDNGTPSASPSQSGSQSASGPANRVLPVASVSAFDPPPNGNGEENDAEAPLAADGKQDTGWNTMTYFDPFGPTGIKEGVGLVLDLGRERSVNRVTVSMDGVGANLELRAAAARGTEVQDYRMVAQSFDESGQAELRPQTAVQARYLLVWLTSLPSTGGSDYRGTINEIEVHGH